MAAGRTGAMAALALVLAGCGLLRRPAPPREGLKEILAGREPLGEVAMVHPELEFVVVKTPHGAVVRDGAVLVTRSGAAQSAKLTASPEKRRGFLSADVAEGAPARGDRVFFQPSAMTEAPAGGDLQPMAVSELPPLSLPSDESPMPPAPASHRSEAGESQAWLELPQ